MFWPDLKVPFEIPEKTFPKGSDSRKTILDAIKHINDKTEVQLFDRKGATTSMITSNTGFPRPSTRKATRSPVIARSDDRVGGRLLITTP